jgi:hypothetical protein
MYGGRMSRTICISIKDKYIPLFEEARAKGMKASEFFVDCLIEKYKFERKTTIENLLNEKRNEIKELENELKNIKENKSKIDTSFWWGKVDTWVQGLKRKNRRADNMTIHSLMQADQKLYKAYARELGMSVADFSKAVAERLGD